MNGLETQLRVGWYFSRKGELYQITHVSNAQLQIEAVHVATQAVCSVSLFELLLSQEEESVAFAPSLQALRTLLSAPRVSSSIDEQGLPETLLARADEIIQLVEMVERKTRVQEHMLGQRFHRTAVLREIVATIPLSLSRYYDLRKLYDQNRGHRAGIATSLRRSTFNQTRLKAAERHFLDTLILRYYARTRPLRPQTLYRLAQSVLQRTDNQWLDPTHHAALPLDVIDLVLNPRIPMTVVRENEAIQALLVPVTLPSRSWFYGYLRWFEALPETGEAVVKARYGKDRWEQEHLVFDTFVTRAAAPLQYVFADHWLLDVFTVDEATRRQVNRLWFTALIDAYSRCILGTALLYEVPCIESIQTALRHAIWPKQRLGQLDGQWICYGIPQQLSLDNAWAHHSHSLEQLARSVSHGGHYQSIDLAFRPPYRGRYGGLIERFFGNLSAQVKEHLPGALTGSTHSERRGAAERACLLYGDLEGFLYDLVVAYQHSPHRELKGMSPHEKWLSSWHGSAPLVPPYTAATERLFWRRAPEVRHITREGIHAFGLTYMTDALRLTSRVRPDGRSVEVNIHYNPNDISVLALFQEGQWLMDVQARELRQPDGRLHPLSLFERELAKTLARQHAPTGRDWLRFLDDIDRLSVQRQHEKRMIQRQGVPRIERDSRAAPDVTLDHLLDAFLRKEAK